MTSHGVLLGHCETKIMAPLCQLTSQCAQAAQETCQQKQIQAFHDDLLKQDKQTNTLFYKILFRLTQFPKLLLLFYLVSQSSSLDVLRVSFGLVRLDCCCLSVRPAGQLLSAPITSGEEGRTCVSVKPPHFTAT